MYSGWSSIVILLIISGVVYSPAYNLLRAAYTHMYTYMYLSPMCRPSHKQGSRGRVYKEDPYVFMTEDSEVWRIIKYEFSDKMTVLIERA